MLNTYKCADWHQGACWHRRIDILVDSGQGMEADNIITLHWRTAPENESICTLELCTTNPRLLIYAEWVARQVNLRHDLSWQDALEALNIRGYRRIA